MFNDGESWRLVIERERERVREREGVKQGVRERERVKQGVRERVRKKGVRGGGGERERRE